MTVINITEKTKTAIWQSEDFTFLMNLLDGANVHWYWAGGSVLEALNKGFGKAHHPINDYDIYFQNKTSLKKMANHLSKQGYSVVCETKNAITYNRENEIPIQLIKKQYGNLTQILENFDIVICSVGVDPYMKLVYADENFFEDFDNDFLTLKKVQEGDFTSIMNAINRVGKYLQKGYFVPPGRPSEFLSETIQNAFETAKDNAFILPDNYHNENMILQQVHLKYNQTTSQFLPLSVQLAKGNP